MEMHIAVICSLAIRAQFQYKDRLSRYGAFHYNDDSLEAVFTL